MDRLLGKALQQLEEAEKLQKEAFAKEEKARERLLRRLITLIRRSGLTDYHNNAEWKKRLGMEGFHDLELFQALTIVKNGSTYEGWQEHIKHPQRGKKWKMIHEPPPAPPAPPAPANIIPMQD
jgi:hypothetical protein